MPTRPASPHRVIRPLALALALATPWGARAEDDPTKFVQFVEDFTSNCVQRNGKQILVRNSHPTRTVKVWLDRFHMGVGTGDRSRSELKPGADPEALGCSRSDSGPQEWRIVRAQFLD